MVLDSNREGVAKEEASTVLLSGSLLECVVDCFVDVVQEFSVTLDETVEEIIEGIDTEVFPVATGD